jgi:hypothetical protein
MAKCVIDFGHSNYVIDADKAVKLMELLDTAEVYQSRWRREDEGGSTKHIYEADRLCSLELISDAKYKMYKLAGKPE